MKTAKKIIIALGIICCLYGGTVVALVSSNHWFNYAGIIVGIFMIAVGIFLERICKAVRKLPKVVIIVLSVIAAAMILHFTIFEANVIRFANSQPEPDARYMIVLGAKVNGETPSLEYQRRIEAAYDYAKEHPDIRIICTGGKGDDEVISESLAAANFLIRNGIDENRVFKEEQSTTTEENFAYAKDFIKGDLSDVVVVSSAFHLYRASLIAKREGYANVSYIGSVGLKILQPHYYIREYASYVKDVLINR